MEQTRLLIAIALSFLIFMIWSFLFPAKKEVPQPEQATKSEQQIEEKTNIKEKEQVIVATPPLQKEVPSKPIQPSRTITVNTPLYKVQIEGQGAVFKSFVLKEYRESLDADSQLFEMISPDISARTVKLGFAGKSIRGLDDAVFSANLKSDSVDIDDKPQNILFSWTSPEGIVVEKNFRFSPETYMIDLNVTIKNGSNMTIEDNLTLTLVQAEHGKKNGSTKSSSAGRYGFEGPSALINNELEQIKPKKIKEKNVFTGKLKWIAIQDRYFMSAVIPDEPVEASMRLYINEDKTIQNQHVQPISEINAGTQHVFKYRLFFGPKSLKRLSKIGYDLVKAVNFGWFDILAKPCVWIMNFLYDHFIPNYGVAIIILTLFTKIILWPLGSKSYKSMAEMKRIQPIMAEMREKYKGDKKRMNEEVMRLYKTYKVNPLGGCLPMVVQIPVFFALYRMLYGAIELRHAPFFLWINDLSAPDRLFSFDISIPFMQPPYGIPVLTIIMGATMFLQQKMSPPMGDPSQAKMMKFMPLAFTVIFINFSSGLVLYWLVNNVISIAQQYYIQKKSA